MTTTKAQVEEQIVETLIAWKNHADNLAQHTAAARLAIVEAKRLKIWDGKYPTFGEWLEKECGITPQWAYQLINSAKIIAQIEDVAERTPELKKLTEPGTVEIVRNMPTRTLQKLKRVSPKKAAQAVLRAVKDTPAGQPVKVATILQQLPRVASRPRIPTDDDHPVLIAMDNEWTQIKRDMGILSLNPKQIYERLRKAVETEVL